MRELAYFYVPGPGIYTLSGNVTGGQAPAEDATLDEEVKAERWQIQHIVFPAFRRYLMPPKSLLEGAQVVQVANLPDLYKVFERC